MQQYLIALAIGLLTVACGGPRDNDNRPIDGDPNGWTIPRDGGDPTTPPGDDSQPPQTACDQGTQLNPGWVGGTCFSESDCSSGQFSMAPTCERDGFVGGMCTQQCTQSSTSGAWICPDEDYGNASTLYTLTRCIEGNGIPRCVAECNFDKSPTGCRPGYACVLRERYNQPTSIFPVCLPCDTQGWPGEPGLGFDIGEACANENDCNHLECLKLNNGYCSKTMCDVAGCPAGSTCFALNEDSSFTACLRDCGNATQCREAENYTCLSQYDICWTDPTPPAWDDTVGATDCANAWSNGLHGCDTTPDDYIVVNKSARNLALCEQGGGNVANFNIGLGFSPTGDKEQEGDGKTPEGIFYIPRVLPTSQYYKAFLLSYPDSADAARGLTDSLINQAQHDSIVGAQNGCTEPPQNTGLGGLIEVHGMGGGEDWTWGCIAVASSEVDVLWPLLAVGDTIVVLP